MSSRAVGQRSGCAIEDRGHHGREFAADDLFGETVEIGQHLRRRLSPMGQSPSGAAQLGHILDGRQPVPDNVADGEIGPVSRQ